MEFRILGPLEVRGAAGRLLVPPRRKQRLLLAVLLLHANAPVSTETLLDLLWPESAPSSARANLQSYVSDLRRLLRGDEPADRARLRRLSGGYVLRARHEELDAAVFERLAGEGRQALAEQQHALAAERLGRSLAQWRGPVLEDLPLPAALRPETERLEELRMTVLEESIEARLALAKPAVLAAELATLTARHPLRERLWAQLMVALYRAGRQAHALDAYQRVYRLLDRELGIRPGEALQQVHRRILSADPTLAPPPAVPPAAAVAARRVPRQLPTPPQMFTGRERELAALDEVQDASTVVISAIDGMAGIGKSALAVHVAHRIAGHYPDGQLFLDLHGHTPGVAPMEPAEALDCVLRQLGVPPPQIPANTDERAALFRHRVADQRMLILLDNAAAESQVAPLLPGTPGSLVLVTSRRRLAGLDRTRTLSLDTLPVPDAVALFTRSVGEDRLAEAPAGLLVELVQLCGRLPLAIRIAAARLRSHATWDLSHLVARLRDLQQRLDELEAGQRSVTAALDLSYQHLSADQQRAYRLLGPHPGSDIDPYAAAALLDSTVTHAGRMLDQLLDAHLLLEPATGRYRFHDLVRAHAAQVAGDGSDPAVRAALVRLLDHYRHTAALATETAYPYEREQLPPVPPATTARPDVPDPARALGWLDAELPNLLAAARYAADHDLPAHLVHLSAVLHRHLRIRGRYHDAELLHRQALSTARATGSRGDELDALVGLGNIHRLQGRLTQAADRYGEALRIARGIDHRSGELAALTGLGDIHRLQGRYAQATDHLERALRLARAAGNRVGELDALNGLATIHRRQGRYAQATDHLEQVLRLAAATGYRPRELDALNGLGLLHRLEGRDEPAADHYERALRIARATGHRRGELDALNGLGHIHRRQGRYAQATDHYRQLLDLAREGGDSNLEFEAQQGLGRVRYATGDPGAAVAYHERALALAGELGQPVDQARAHDGIAHARQALGDDGRAREHWRLALEILTGLGVDHTDDEETTAAAIRAHLSAPAGTPAGTAPAASACAAVGRGPAVPPEGRAD
ncbi:tetratricopeptide repeat protein [Micromonospora sp. NPDC049559]|uniref:AfsR/SARP family transcriptional regulator n=1 Tax=Micromonospora sp. NPDC049559 TaxID=3155923 RepID=UPI003421CB19